MVKYKEFIQSKLAKFNNLPKKWQQISIFIVIIMVIGVYCFFSENETQIATSKNLANDNMVLKDTVKEENNKMIYETDKDIAVIKNPFSFAHEQADDLVAKNSGNEIQVDENTRENQFEDTTNISDDRNDKITENKLNNEKIKRDISTQNNEKIYKLKAILNFNHEMVALFSINDKVYRVHQGDIIDDIKIIAIEKDKLILQDNTGKNIDCPLT